MSTQSHFENLLIACLGKAGYSRSVLSSCSVSASSSRDPLVPSSRDPLVPSSRGSLSPSSRGSLSSSSRGLTAGSSEATGFKPLDPAVKPRDDEEREPRDDGEREPRDDGERKLRDNVGEKKKTITKTHIQQFAQYLALMVKWNQAYNLTAITDPKEMVLRHILDSLAVNEYLEGDRIIDVGSGAGLPGIPLAIINPDKKFVLLDSNGKKTRFLTQVVTELCLENVDIIHERAENVQDLACFDDVISRAFASISKMLTLTKHLCYKNGQFLAMKGPDYIEELKDLPKGFEVKWIKSLKVPDLEAERYLVCIVMLDF